MIPSIELPKDLFNIPVSKGTQNKNEIYNKMKYTKNEIGKELNPFTFTDESINAFESPGELVENERDVLNMLIDELMESLKTLDNNYYGRLHKYYEPLDFISFYDELQLCIQEIERSLNQIR